jgi:hypothetical protein
LLRKSVKEPFVRYVSRKRQNRRKIPQRSSGKKEPFEAICELAKLINAWSATLTVIVVILLFFFPSKTRLVFATLTVS